MSIFSILLKTSVNLSDTAFVFFSVLLSLLFFLCILFLSFGKDTRRLVKKIFIVAVIVSVDLVQ